MMLPKKIELSVLLNNNFSMNISYINPKNNYDGIELLYLDNHSTAFDIHISFKFGNIYKYSYFDKFKKAANISFPVGERVSNIVPEIKRKYTIRNLKIYYIYS